MATTAPGTVRTAPARRTEPLRLARTTGALSGLVVLVLGVWGGLIPFVGPYFHYAFGGFTAWHFTMQRLWLDIIPGAVAVVGGFMLLTAVTRTGGLIGGWLAVAAGAWFAIGPVVSLLWHHTIYAIGVPAGGYTRQMLEWLGFFYGIGALIIGFAAFAMGRYFSRPRIVEEPVVAAEAAAAERPVAGRRAAGGAAVGAAAAGGAVAERHHEERRAAEAEAGGAPATERAGYAEPAAREGYAEPAATAPTTANAPADAPTTANAPVDAPATGATTAPATGATTAPATGATTAPATGASTATAPRRRPGLLARLRGR